jgi:hypothetical protein
MEDTAQSQSEQHSDDWLAGATIEFGGEVGECTQVALEGIEFGSDENVA